jgi:purine catabolism regulator
MVVVAVLEPDAVAAVAPAPEDRRAWQDRFAHAWRQVASTVDDTIA